MAQHNPHFLIYLSKVYKTSQTGGGVPEEYRPSVFAWFWINVGCALDRKVLALGSPDIDFIFLFNFLLKLSRFYLHVIEGTI